MSEKNPIICIIDDNLEDRALFRGYLLQDTDYHYSIYEEDTGEKGLALCRAVRPDCILLDYNLPDINGLAFLAALVDEAESVPFAVVMLAGLEEESSALRAVKNGAQDYLVKSEMTPGNLFRSIHSAIERTSIRRIVERQRLDLERKNQETQAFAYALAHDLRAPLRAISSFGQIL
ncbi:MAG TPA: response regulator, partial [Ktedonobacteraceae bacterium]|nr:response regulator [Ktedonobacteraceae bacterium]